MPKKRERERDHASPWHMVTPQQMLILLLDYFSVHFSHVFNSFILIYIMPGLGELIHWSVSFTTIYGALGSAPSTGPGIEIFEEAGAVSAWSDEDLNL